MALVSNEAKEILKKHGHQYSKMSDTELQTIVKAVSSQDAGNYDGKFVGNMASSELILRAAKRIEYVTLFIAAMSLLVSGYSIFEG